MGKHFENMAVPSIAWLRIESTIAIEASKTHAGL